VRIVAVWNMTVDVTSEAVESSNISDRHLAFQDSRSAPLKSTKN
jgi:hypothetical protein